MGIFSWARYPCTAKYGLGTVGADLGRERTRKRGHSSERKGETVRERESVCVRERYRGREEEREREREREREYVREKERERGREGETDRERVCEREGGRKGERERQTESVCEREGGAPWLDHACQPHTGRDLRLFRTGCESLPLLSHTVY